MSKPTKEMSAVEALRFAITALNTPSNFLTAIPNPNKPGKFLKSYELIPMLESVARREESVEHENA